MAGEGREREGIAGARHNIDVGDMIIVHRLDLSQAFHVKCLGGEVSAAHRRTDRTTTWKRCSVWSERRLSLQMRCSDDITLDAEPILSFMSN